MGDVHDRPLATWKPAFATHKPFLRTKESHMSSGAERDVSPMTLVDRNATDAAMPPEEPLAARGVLASFFRALSPRRVSLLYVTGAFLVVFAFWIPETFFTSSTLQALLYQQAVTGVVAIAFLIPYTTLNFDLTAGALVGVSSLATCWFIVNAGLPILVAILLGLLVCSLIGCLTGLLVTVCRISSIIATIAMMFVIDALGTAANGGRQVLDLPAGFVNLTSHEIFGIAMPFYYLMAISLVAWYALTQTPFGRYLYAIGGSREAARLAGVRVDLVVFVAFMASAVLAGVAGVLVSSRVGAGDFTVGEPYLFPAAAAIFLGSTQVKPGVFNVWGTVLAVYGLGAIVKGLQLGGAPFWVADLMNGAALLAAVALGDLTIRMRRTRASRGADGA
jgi:ribose transport system permease protein